MRSKLIQGVTDVLYLFLHRIKLVMRDTSAFVILIISLMVFSWLLQSMSAASQDVSSIPLGIVDNDRSISSEKLIKGLKEAAAIRIVEKDEKELQRLLQDELVTAVFVIENGYEEKLLAGKLRDLITMYYKKDDQTALLVSDIVAGEMIYPVGLYEAYRYYEQLPDKAEKMTLKQYKEFMDQFIEDSHDFDYAFVINYVSSEKNTNANISNSLLYNQIIIGILGTLIAFIAMFILSQTVREKEYKVEYRLAISRFYKLKQDMGNLAAMLFWEDILALIFATLIYHQLNFEEIGLWFSIYLFLLLLSLVQGGIMLLIAKGVKRIIYYQVFCSIVILITTGLGFYSLISGFFGGFLGNYINFIPNSWFIMGFTDIIIYGSSQGYLNEGHRVLLIMAAVVLLLVIGIDLIRELKIYPRMNRNRTVR